MRTRKKLASSCQFWNVRLTAVNDASRKHRRPLSDGDIDSLRALLLELERRMSADEASWMALIGEYLP